MESSQIQTQLRHTPSTLVSSPESIEISIEDLVRSWKRRHRWQLCYGSCSSKQLSDDRAPWRTHLTNFLESTQMHFITISLLLIDLVMVILQLSSNLVSCTMNKGNNKKAEVLYHWVGIGILTILSLKSVALIVGLGNSFFRCPGLVADGVVVIGALLLEVILERVGVGLIVVVSLWRVLRVIESVFEVSDEATEARITSILSKYKSLQEENGKLSRIITEKDEIIEELHEELDQEF